jgi:hypothetical protein
MEKEMPDISGTHARARKIYRNLLARLISPPPPEPPPDIWFFMYIFSAISAAELTADCLSPDYKDTVSTPSSPKEQE